MDNFAGKPVSIKLKRGLGVFQGTITCAEAHAITIANVFHNGNKIDYKNSEVSAKISNFQDQPITLNYFIGYNRTR